MLSLEGSWDNPPLPLPAFGDSRHALACCYITLTSGSLFIWLSLLYLCEIRLCLPLMRMCVIGFRVAPKSRMTSLNYICNDCFPNKVAFTGLGCTYLLEGHAANYIFSFYSHFTSSVYYTSEKVEHFLQQLEKNLPCTFLMKKMQGKFSETSHVQNVLILLINIINNLS